jgi:hypothetical protein
MIKKILLHLLFIFILLILGDLINISSIVKIKFFESLGDFLTMLNTIIISIISGLALYLTHQAGLFERKPEVVASGVLIISKKTETNKQRDDEIDQKNSIHTFQLINIGRGVAKNIIPSKNKHIKGAFLEDICPHSFALAPGKGTRDLGEILRVHGQDFKNEFYIDFEDHNGKSYKTKVNIEKVNSIDQSIRGGRIEKLKQADGIEIWKIMKNIKNNI